MDKESIEGYETPLEQTLADLPQEEAPEGLQDRCLAALEAAPQKSGGWETWRQLVAAAAVIVMLVGAGRILAPTFVVSREKARQVPRQFSSYDSGQVATGPAAPAGPAPMSPGMSTAEAPRNQLGTPYAARRFARDKIAQTDAIQSPRSPAMGVSVTGGDEVSAGRSGGAAGKPWREEPGERRKVTSRSMELEVPEVEEAYKQAVVIIEKAGGYVMQEDLAVRERGQDEVRIEAKIPVEQFDGVMAQVRELGKVVLLTGQSQDRTLDYEQEGADVRVMAAEIERLAGELEKATTQGQKRMLRGRIEGLKRQLEESKQDLRGIHRATSYAQLSLTMKEARGLRYLVTSAAREALPLAMSLALIAVPLLVLALVWKRKR
ncbi:MAG: DUF4349 domain-containing protein [Armatimonadia bacterium]